MSLHIEGWAEQQEPFRILDATITRFHWVSLKVSLNIMFELDDGI